MLCHGAMLQQSRTGGRTDGRFFLPLTSGACSLRPERERPAGGGGDDRHGSTGDEVEGS